MTFTRTLALSAAVLASIGGAASAQTGERADLAWQLKQGDVLHYALSATSEQAMGIGGGMSITESSSSTRATLTLEVRSVDAQGAAQIDATVTSLKVRQQSKAMGMMQPPLEYDSLQDDPTVTGLAKAPRVLRHAVGKHFSFSLSQDGQVSDVKGGAELREAIAKAADEELQSALQEMGGNGQGGGMGGGMGGMPGMNTGAMVRLVVDQFTAFFADEVLEETLQAVHHVLPSGPKAEGESWTEERSEMLGLLGKLTYTAKFSHGGSVGPMTRIRIGVDGEPRVSRESNDMGGPDAGNPMARMAQMMTRNLAIKQATVEGAATFGKGRLSDTEITRSVMAEGPVPPMLAAMGGGGGGQDAKMSLNTKQVFRYEVQDGPPAASPPSSGEDDGEGGDDDRDM